MNGWKNLVAAGLFGFLVAAASGLVAYGRVTGGLTEKVEAQGRMVDKNSSTIMLNTAAINALAREQSTMAANIEWIRRSLERQPPN